MASIGDVRVGLCRALASYMFPGQAYQLNDVQTYSAPWTMAPGGPVISFPLRLAPGTFTTEETEPDIKAGVSNVGVAQKPGFSRNSTKFLPYRQQLSSNVPTLLAALSDGVVTFGGGSSPNQIVQVQAGQTIYAYLTNADDTPATVAAAIADQIPTGQAYGAVLTATDIVSVQIAAWQSGIFVVGQTEAIIEVTTLATPAKANGSIVAGGSKVREAISYGVDRLKSMVDAEGWPTQLFSLPDGSRARAVFWGSNDDDTPRRADLWRRWTDFRVEYDTAIYENWPVMLAPLIVGNTNGEHILWFGPGAPATNILTDGQGNILTDSAGGVLGAFA